MGEQAMEKEQVGVGARIWAKGLKNRRLIEVAQIIGDFLTGKVLEG